MPNEPVLKAQAVSAILRLENLIDDVDAEDVENMPQVCQAMRNQLAIVRQFVAPRDGKADVN